MASPTPLAALQDAACAAALLDPLRLRLLEELAEPASASALARRLKLPRQKLNYHLRELEKHGLAELVEERRRGNCTERVLRASARSYLISPAALGALGADPSRVQDRFSSSYLIALAARIIREVAVLQEAAEKAEKRLATLTLQTEIRFVSAAQRHRFAEELAQSMADLTAKYHDEQAEGGRWFRFVMGVYPRPRREGNEPAEGRGQPGRSSVNIPSSWRTYE
jgi:DNA-binding transcriptional ArsR family regulator